MQKSEKYTLDSTVRLAIRIVIILSVFFLVRHLSAVLFPFVMGWFIAYLLYPLVIFVQKKLRVTYRIPSIIIVLLLMLALVVGALWLLVPMIVNETVRIMPYVADYIKEIPFIENFDTSRVEQFLASIDYEKFLSFESIDNILGKVLPPVWGVISSVWKIALGVVSIFLITLYMFFILTDYEKINEGLIQIFSRKYQRFARDLKADLSRAMSQYFRGQAIVGLITGVLYCIGLSIIGLPMAIAMGLLVGLLSIIPYLQLLGMIPIVFFAFIGSIESGTSLGMMLLGVGVVFVVIEALTEVLVIPKIMGKQMGLKPAIILLSLSVFGTLLGFIGLIIALPLTTIILSYYKRFIVGNEAVGDVATVEAKVVDTVPKAEEEPQEATDTEEQP